MYRMADQLVELGCCVTLVLIHLYVAISFFCVLCVLEKKKKNHLRILLLSLFSSGLSPAGAPRRWASGGERSDPPVMRFRISRKLPVVAKAGCLLWLLWLGYLLLERSSFPPNSPPEDAEEARHLAARRLSLEETGSDGQLARPLYVKPPLDDNAPGEWGRAARLNLSPDEKKQEEDSVERYAINIFVSDKISLHRHIQDHRMKECVRGSDSGLAL